MNETNDEEVLLAKYLQPGYDVSSLLSFIVERLQENVALRIVIYGQRLDAEIESKLEVSPKLEQETSDEEEDNFVNCDNDSEIDDDYDENAIPKIINFREPDEEEEFDKKANVRTVCMMCCKIILKRDLKKHELTCKKYDKDSEVSNVMAGP